MKEIKILLSSLEKQGWRIERIKKGWLVYPPDRQKSPVTIHGTPSDRNWQRVVMRHLKSSGYHEGEQG